MTGQKASGIKKKKKSTLEVISLLLLTVLVCSITAKAENLKVKQISAGNSHTAVIAADNSLWTFGDNESGELGAGSADDSKIPVRIMTNVNTVSAGHSYTAVIKSDGSLWMSGENRWGQFGSGTRDSSLSFIQIMSDVKAVSTARFHTGIIKTDDSLWMCGENEYGEIGDGTGSYHRTPVKIADNVKTVSLGYNHTAFLKNDGTLWTCGLNEDGQLGDGTRINRNTPVQIMSDVKDVSAGDLYTAILKTDGTLWVCGSNTWGQYGNGTTSRNQTPVQIMSNVKTINAGGGHTAVIMNDGSLWMSGYNAWGQVGDGTTENKTSFVHITDDVAKVDCSLYHTVFVKTDGSLWICGSNYDGQIGDGTTTARYSPVMIQIGNSEKETEKETETESAPETEEKVFTITFNPNEGKLKDSTTNKKEVINGKKYGTLLEASRPGYAFLGWFTKKDGGSEIKKNTIVNLTRNRTLYAHWVKRISIKDTTIKIAACTFNGQKQKPKVTVKYRDKKLVADTDYTVKYTNNKYASSKAAAVIQGIGLYKGKITRKFTIKRLNITDPAVIITLDKTIFNETKDYIKPGFSASYKVGKKKVAINRGEDLAVKYKNNKKIGNAKVIFTGRGNFTGKLELPFIILKKVTANYTLKLNTGTSTMKAKMNGRSVIPFVSNEAVTGLPTPTMKGYTFLGWYTKKSGGTPIRNGKTVTMSDDTRDKNLYAHWEIDTYKIIFDQVNWINDPSVPDAITYTVEDEVKLPNPPENYKKQYIRFYGWTKKKNGSNVYVNIPKGTTGNIRLYPKFDYLYYHIILQWDSNGKTVTKILDQLLGKKTVLPPATMTPPEDMAFDYWKCDETKQTYTNKATVGPVSEEKTYHLTAQWKRVYQKALWFMDYVKISQVPGGGYSHAGTLNFDVVGYNGNSNIKAPFDCTIVRIHTEYKYGNTVIIQSDKPVQYADGTIDYMSMAFAHDNDVSDLQVGQKLLQGDVFYQTGDYGNVTGVHSHVTCIKGQYKGNMWASTSAEGNSYCPDQINPVDALFLGKASVIDTKGLTFKKK